MGPGQAGPAQKVCPPIQTLTFKIPKNGNSNLGRSCSLGRRELRAKAGTEGLCVHLLIHCNVRAGSKGFSPTLKRASFQSGGLDLSPKWGGIPDNFPMFFIIRVALSPMGSLDPVMVTVPPEAFPTAVKILGPSIQAEFALLTRGE